MKQSCHLVDFRCVVCTVRLCCAHGWEPPNRPNRPKRFNRLNRFGSLEGGGPPVCVCAPAEPAEAAKKSFQTGSAAGGYLAIPLHMAAVQLITTSSGHTAWIASTPDREIDFAEFWKIHDFYRKSIGIHRILMKTTVRAMQFVSVAPVHLPCCPNAPYERPGMVHGEPRTESGKVRPEAARTAPASPNG